MPSPLLQAAIAFLVIALSKLALLRNVGRFSLEHSGQRLQRIGQLRNASDVFLIFCAIAMLPRWETGFTVTLILACFVHVILSGMMYRENDSK